MEIDVSMYVHVPVSILSLKGGGGGGGGGGGEAFDLSYQPYHREFDREVRPLGGEIWI